MSDRLDRIERDRAPGSGSIVFAGVAGPEFAGAKVDVEARLRESLSVFAEGYAGWRREALGWEESWGAQAGLRYRW